MLKYYKYKVLTLSNNMKARLYSYFECAIIGAFSEHSTLILLTQRILI